MPPSPFTFSSRVRDREEGSLLWVVGSGVSVDGKGCREISYEQVDVDMYIIFYKHCAAFHVSLGLYAYHWTSFSFFHLNHMFSLFFICLVLFGFKTSDEIHGPTDTCWELKCM